MASFQGWVQIMGINAQANVPVALAATGKFKPRRDETNSRRVATN